MTKKIKLTVARRDIIEEYGLKHIKAGIDRTQQNEYLEALIAGANQSIRAKYPEADMEVIRKYKLERTDRCLRFQFPSGRVDGFSFGGEAPIVDMPRDGGCRPWGISETFPVSEAVEHAFDGYAKAKKEADQVENDRISAFLSFVRACKSVDEVMEVIDLPQKLRERLGQGSTALVAVTPETVTRLRDTFRQAA